MREDVVRDDEPAGLEERTREREETLVVVFLGIEKDEIEGVLRRTERLECISLDQLGPLVEADAFGVLAGLEDIFDVVFLDAWKGDYEALFALARRRLEPGGLVVADNVLSHVEELGAYSEARQSDPTLTSVTVPLDRGLELSVVLR